MSFGLVFLAHAGLSHIVPGGFGVTVFFFLSGYLITTLLQLEHTESGSISFKNFFYRRALRILPPMYFTLAAAFFAGVWWPGLQYSPDSLGIFFQSFYLTNYLMIFTDHKTLPGTHIMWSLAIEEHFYLIYPFVFLMLINMRKATATLAVAGICMLILAWRSILVYVFLSAPSRTYLATDTRIDSILFGCLLAIAWNPWLGQVPRVLTRYRHVTLILALAGLLSTFLYRDPGFRESLRYTIQGICLMPLFYFAVKNPEMRMFSWLNWRPLAFLGTISYAMYLGHSLALAVSRKVFPELGTVFIGILAAAGTFSYAYLMHILIERPLAKLRSRLRHSSPPTTSIALNDDEHK